MKRPVTLITGIIAAAMLVALAVYHLTAPGATPPEPPGSTGQPSSPAGTTVMSFERKIQELTRDLNDVCRTGQSREVSLTLTEQEATEGAARLLSDGGTGVGMEVKGLSIDLQKGNLLLTSVDAIALGITFNLKVTSSIEINNGKLNVAVVSVEVPLVLSSFKETLAEMVRQRTEGLLAQVTTSGVNCKLDITYTEVQTQDDSITVKALARPTQ